LPFQRPEEKHEIINLATSLAHLHDFRCDEKKRIENDSSVATSVIYNFASPQVAPTLYVNPKPTSRELEGLLSKVKHLERAWTSWHAPISPKGKISGSTWLVKK
jgi:hypothetical protein